MVGKISSRWLLSLCCTFHNAIAAGVKAVSKHRNRMLAFRRYQLAGWLLKPGASSKFRRNPSRCSYSRFRSFVRCSIFLPLRCGGASSDPIATDGRSFVDALERRMTGNSIAIRLQQDICCGSINIYIVFRIPHASQNEGTMLHSFNLHTSLLPKLMMDQTFQGMFRVCRASRKPRCKF